MFSNTRIIISMFLLFLLSVGIVRSQVIEMNDKYSGDTREKIVFLFDSESTAFDRDYKDNSATLSRLDVLMTEDNALLGLDSLVLVVKSSIEGPYLQNEQLVKARAQAVTTVLLSRYSEIEPHTLRTRFIVEDWNGLRQAIEADDNVPYKSEVLDVIAQTYRASDNREWVLKILRNRTPWKYLQNEIFPLLGQDVQLVFYYGANRAKMIQKQNDERNEQYTSSAVAAVDTVDVVEPIETAEPVVEIVEEVAENNNYIAPTATPGFQIALKTNLLYDAVAALNVEAEFPLGNRWSIAAEWISPWWKSSDKGPDSKRQFYQILSGNIETKYWLGNRNGKQRLTGWFVGAYGGAGNYDLEYNYKGYQGDFWHAGLSTGYAHTINKSGSLRMEYSIGLGYLSSDYVHYEDNYMADPHNVWYSTKLRSDVFNWIGPTKAKVSLVWLIGQ